MIESVVNRCNELSNPVDHCHISRAKHNKRKEMEAQEEMTSDSICGKKFKNGDTSTPMRGSPSKFTSYRMSPSILTPIKCTQIYDLSGSLDSLGSSFSSTGERASIRSAGMSPQLRKLLITPRGDDEDLVELLRATIDLTRAALARGLINEQPGIIDETTINLGSNALFKPCGDKGIDPLLHMMNKLEIDEWFIGGGWKFGGR